MTRLTGFGILIRTHPIRRLASVARRMISATRLPRIVFYVVSVPGRLAAAWQKFQWHAAQRAIDERRRRRRASLQRLAGTREPAVLFLVPEAGLAPYYASHAILARTAMEAGRTAIMLSCNGILPMCSWKFARRMAPTASGETKNPACESCMAQARTTGDEYGLIDVPIESLLGDAEKQEIVRILAENRTALWETTVDGIPFGTVAKGEVLRQSRLLEVSEFSLRDHQLLEGVLHTALASYFAVKILAGRYAIERIVYFGDYAYWLVAIVLARRLGIGVLNVDHAYHRDIDRRLIALRPDSVNVHMFHHQIGSWPKYRHRPIEPSAVKKIADSGLFRLVGHGGISTFSPNWVLRDTPIQAELGLSPDRKTLVAYPSSSDEVVALRQIMALFGKPYGPEWQAFPDQVAWVRALSDWVGERSDLQLVIRMHPRIGLSHRHNSKSSEYVHFREALTTLPSNVVVVWPESKISSYNLAEIADVALVSWSTIGLELARFGVPVIAAFSGFGAYPTGDFAKYANSRAGYFGLIEAMAGSAANVADITDAFRWTYYVHVSPLVDVSDVVPIPDYGAVPPWRRPKSHRTIERAVINGEDLSALNMERLPLGHEAERRERQALVETLQHVLLFFATGDAGTGVRAEEIRADSGGFISYVSSGQVSRRYSPLAARLVRLLAELTDADVRVVATTN